MINNDNEGNQLPKCVLVLSTKTHFPLWVAGKLVSFTTRSECIDYGQEVWAYCINASKI